MSDCKICSKCAGEGSVGIMIKAKESDLALNGQESGTSYKCEVCGTVSQEKGGKNSN